MDCLTAMHCNVLHIIKNWQYIFKKDRKKGSHDNIEPKTEGNLCLILQGKCRGIKRYWKEDDNSPFYTKNISSKESQGKDSA